MSFYTQEYAEKALLKDPKSITAFVELHIEQGPHLEAGKKDIGIVEAIMAPSLLRIEFTGRGGHGGVLHVPLILNEHLSELSVGSSLPRTMCASCNYCGHVAECC